MRMTICRSSRMALVLVGVALAPTFAGSQEAAARPREHVVQRGETLRGIARHYLGDPAKWVEIHKLNSAELPDPQRIYPGQRIRIPSTSAVTARQMPAQDSSARAETPAVAAAPLPSMQGSTLFAARNARSIRANVQPASTTRRSHEPPPAVRVGEYLAAPYVDVDGGPSGSGKLVGTGEVPGIPLTESERFLDLQERVFIVPPAGRTAMVGDRYVVYRLGTELPGLGQLVIPTGVVAVERSTAGQAAEARIVAKYEQIVIGQGLLSVVLQLPPESARATSVANGALSRIAWVDQGTVLPSIQRYVVLDRGAAAGMRIGDQVTFFRGRREGLDGVTLPESEIGVAQVVRVGPSAATALIVGQSQPAIEEGTTARVTAKMP